MHVTKLTHIASGATAYGSACRASVEKRKNAQTGKSIIRIYFLMVDNLCCVFETMHVAKLTHIASGATAYGSA